MNSSLHIIFKRGLGMMLVFEFCKGAGKKVKASVCLELWQGLVAFNLTRPALPSPRAHPLSPTYASGSGACTPTHEPCPGVSEPTSICPLQGALTAQDLFWVKAGEGEGVRGEEVGHMDSVLTTT